VILGHYTFNTAFSLVAIMLIMFLGGCDKSAEEEIPVQYSDPKGSLDCRVTVYVPSSSKNSRPRVNVYWDGKELFSGNIPSHNSTFDGMPLKLIEITTSHGSHILELRSGDSILKQDVRLKDKGKQCYKINDTGKKGIVIEDLGPNPLFR